MDFFGDQFSFSTLQLCGWKLTKAIILGVSSVKQVNSLPRRQRSQSLERAKSPSHKAGDVRAGAGELKQFPFPGLRQPSPTNVYNISDPDMMASKLVEQEYLQSLGRQGILSIVFLKFINISKCFYRTSQKCQKAERVWSAMGVI